MPNLLLEISYLGTKYGGSQVQKNCITIQEHLNKAIKKYFNSKSVKTVFSGRTDAGVHALAQTVSVRVGAKRNIESVAKVLNSLLPEDIKVTKAKYVAEDLNARYAAKKRTYLYNVFIGKQLPLWLKEKAWLINDDKLNLQLMTKCCSLIRGKHDFSSFCAAGSSAKSGERIVYRAKLKQKMIKDWPGSENNGSGRLITFEITANGFLYRMVRNIMAAMVDVGKGKMTISDLKKIIESKNRKKLISATAPAAGLILYKVEY